MAAYGYAGVVEAVRDPKLALAKFAGATVTPEAAISPAAASSTTGGSTIATSISAASARRRRERDLFAALTAVVGGKPVPRATTQAVGCFIADFAR